jgi:hypothetical protein
MKMHNLLNLFLFLAFLAPSGLAQDLQGLNSCDFCLASQGISPAEAGATGIRADIRYLRLSTAYNNGGRVSNEKRELETHFTQQFTFSLGLSPAVSLMAIVPLARRYSERLSDDGSMVYGEQFGVADVSLLVRWKMYENHSVESTTIISVAGGMKLPTGRTEGVDSRRELLDAHVQLGSGSTDALAGVNGIFAGDRAALIVNLLFGAAGMGAHGHQFGANVNYEAAVRYKVYPAEYSDMQFFAVLGIDGEWRGKEKQDGVPDENSGGNVAFLSPGLQWFLSPALSLEGRVEFPFTHALSGFQLGEDMRIRAGVQILL